MKFSLKLLFSALISLISLAFLFTFLLRYYCGTLHGEWVDQTIGQILSEKYGETVTVKNVKIASWRNIHFQTMKVYSKENQLLVSAAAGRIHLKKLSLKINTNFETEIDLSDALFSKRYFKDSKGLKPWIYLMRKPIQVKDLRINIAQGSGLTSIRVLKCDSNNIVLSGSMVLNNKGILKDNFLVSFSPLKMLWMMI